MCSITRMKLQLRVLLGSAAAVIMAVSGLWASGTVLLLFNAAAAAALAYIRPPFSQEIYTPAGELCVL